MDFRRFFYVPFILYQKISNCIQYPKKETEWITNHIRRELNHDLRFLQQFPRGQYIALNAEQQREIDDSVGILKITKDQYGDRKMDHLWQQIPSGAERNELLAKKRRIELILEQIPEGA